MEIESVGGEEVQQEKINNWVSGGNALRGDCWVPWRREEQKIVSPNGSSGRKRAYSEYKLIHTNLSKEEEEGPGFPPEKT